jgi:hypothetical protein
MKKVLLGIFTLGVSFIGNSQVIFNVQAPESLEGSYDMTYVDDWGQTPDLLNGGITITGVLHLVNDGSNADSLGCGSLTNGADINDKIAVVYRGDCQFGTKALNAQQAGAIAVVIINNIPGGPVGMGPGTDGPNVTIPVVMIGMEDGALLRDEIDAGNITVFIGNKSGLFENDLGFYKEHIFYPMASSIPMETISNASDFSYTPAIWINNYGSKNQTDAFVKTRILKDGIEIYNESSSNLAINSTDSLLVSLPVFSQDTYEAGVYTVHILVGIEDIEDEFERDNSFSFSFILNEKNVFAYARYDEEGVMQRSGGSRGSNSSDFTGCIVYRSPKASLFAFDKVEFGIVKSGGADIDGENVTTLLFEWTQQFENLDALEIDQSSFILLGQGDYDFDNSLVNSIGAVHLLDNSTFNSGSGYTSSTSATTTNGNGEGLIVDVISETNGEVIDYLLSTNGTNYESGIATTTTLGEGTGLLVDVIAEEIGQVIDYSLSTNGTNYESGIATTTNLGEGTGLLVDVVAEEIGQVTDYILSTSGTNYLSVIEASTIGGSGIGLLVDVIAEEIGQVTDYILNTSGSNYNDEINVTTTGGSGTGLVVEISSNIGEVVSVTVTDGGIGYEIDDVITINGGDENATFTVLDVTDGAIVSITLNEGGIGYEVDDVITINGGDENATFTVLEVTEGAIVSITLTDGGAGYTIDDIIMIDGGDENATFTVLDVTDGAIVSITLNEGGTGYAIDDIITIDGGDENATFTVLDVTDGVILSITINEAGTGYQVGDVITIVGGNEDATINVESIGAVNGGDLVFSSIRDNNGDFISLENNKRYLVCVNTSNDEVFVSWDNGTDRRRNIEEGDKQPHMAIMTTNGWSLGFSNNPYSTPSIAAHFVRSAELGLSHQKDVVNITPYPNPAVSVLNIPLVNLDGNATLQIVDVMGRSVKNEKVSINGSILSVDVTTIPNGTYLFNMNFENGKSSTFRVVINK